MSILGPGHCDTCKWWGGERQHDDEQPWGRCRATPPVVHELKTLTSTKVHDIDVMRGEWLWTAFDDWCASHRDKSKSVGL
jgi:hypothetical protein